jgi:hypothetical protein
VRIIYWLIIIVLSLVASACGGGAGGGGSNPVAVPTVSLSAATTTIDAGQSTTLTWTSTDATSCNASGAWSGVLAASGNQSTAALSDDATYSITCTGPGGASHSASVAITVNALPTAQLTANPTTISVGGASTLSWSSVHATACAASGDWSGALASSGTQSTGALSSNASFSVTCSGAGGTSSVSSAAVTVNPLPTASLTATPTAVAVGTSSTLTWSSTNADSCTASGGWSGTLAPSGTQSTGAISASTTYSIICTGAGGFTTPIAATVVIIPPPSASISASPTSVMSGSSALLTWSSTNATACAASGNWSGSLAISGSQSTGPLTTASAYSLTCVGPGGVTPPLVASVGILPAPVVTLVASPAALAAGGTATLTWSASNATTCTASGGWSGSLSPSGSQGTGPVSAATVYSLSCAGSGGTSSASTTVNIIPAATLSVTPSVVAPGATAILTWSSSNAISCTASNGWTGTQATSGTQATAAVSATTSYSLICSGPGGNSNSATATLTVSNVTMSLSPQNAALTLTRTQQFNATVPGGGNATWTVDGIAGGNSTVGVISATGLYTAGVAGTHSIVATSVANTTQSATGIAAVTDLAGVYTYHNDLSRDGANIHEFALTPANVNTGSFGKLASCAVDGAIYGQPLWVANVTVSGVKHNVVFVTTQHDSLYAFDADSNSTCIQLWMISLIDAAHGGTAGETPVPSTLVGVGSGDIQPEIGVNGTSVIDASSANLYVVSKSISSAQTTFYQRLHAIDITTGNEQSGSPALIAGSYPGTADGLTTVGFSTKQQNQRAGLALVNGTVFVAWGSHEDSSPWYGWIMGYQYNAGAWTQTAVFNSTPNVRGGGIWMGGGAPAVDASNYLYFLTGNGNFDANSSTAPNNDYGDSLLQVNSSLQVISYFTPSDELADVQGDKDFGSGGAAVLADLPAGNTVTHALVCGGKDGTLYVLNRDLLGGFGDSAAVQPIAVGHALFSTAAFWNGYLFAAGAGGPLNAYQLNSSTVQFTLASSSTHAFGFPGSTTSVSAAANTNGVVWALDTHSYCTHQSSSCGPAVLYAYDVTNLGAELWNSSLAAGDTAGNAVKFSVPTVANGRVYVATRGNNTGGADSATSTPGELEIYGLIH